MAEFRRGIQVNIKPYEYLKGRLNAEQVLDELGITVSTVRGAQFMCHCPYHEDNSPSFGFNSDKLAYNCFSCGGHGTVVDLVKTVLGYDDDKAHKFLEEHSNLADAGSEDLLERVQKIMHAPEKKEVMPELNQGILNKFDKVHPYIFERGVTEEVAREMRVSYDEDHCGIAMPHIFMGKLVGIQSRHLAMLNDKYICPTCEGRVPKYINTGRFPKVNTLYGYDQMKNYCGENKLSEVIVVESPFTVLYLKSHGYPNVVATFGLFSREQAMLLAPFEKVYYWPDNDDTGKANVENAIEFLRRFTTLYIVPTVPGQKSDAANVAEDDIEKYLQNAYISSLYPKNGLLEFTDIGH